MRRWIEPHRFLDDHPRVSQLGKVLVLRWAAAEHSLDLGMEFCFLSRMLREQIPYPSERQRRRFVPGHENSNNLVTDFLTAHAARVLFIARSDKAPQQIVR